MKYTFLLVMTILGLQNCYTSGLEKTSLLFGMGPSHIISSPDNLFMEGLSAWEETRKVIDLYKFKWKQLGPDKHVNQPRYTWGRLSPGPFVKVMNAHGIRILSEFKQLHYAVMA